MAPVWMAFAIALSLIARRLRINTLAYQQHVLAVAVMLQLFYVNLFASATRDRYLPILLCAGASYAISRFCTLKEAAYRLTGMSLLLLCVAKIIVFDAWQLGQRDRYITFIALGAALTLVSTLYGKYRETIRRLL